MAVIQLTKGAATFVDDCDFAAFSKWKWHFSCRGYASRRGSKLLQLHRVILGITDPDVHVDHIDGDKLNNRRANLRVCLNSQNAKNRGAHKDGVSKFKGVCWHRGAQKWMAAIQSDKKYKYLGLFKNEADAAIAYNFAAIDLHGDFARLNSIGA